MEGYIVDCVKGYMCRRCDVDWRKRGSFPPPCRLLSHQCASECISNFILWSPAQRGQVQSVCSQFELPSTWELLDCVALYSRTICWPPEVGLLALMQIFQGHRVQHISGGGENGNHNIKTSDCGSVEKSGDCKGHHHQLRLYARRQFLGLTRKSGNEVRKLLWLQKYIRFFFY